MQQPPNHPRVQVQQTQQTLQLTADISRASIVDTS